MMKAVTYIDKKGKKMTGLVEIKKWKHPLDIRTESFVKGRMSLKSFLKCKTI